MTAPAQQTSPQQQSPAERLAEAAAVVATYQASTVAVRGQLEGFIRALWASLGQYRAPQMRDFTGQALPVVQGAMGHMADLTSGYLAAFADVHGHPVPPLPSRAPTIERVRNGADPTEVYERPFHLVWRQLADLPHEPGSIEQAIGAGEDRAVQTALTDVQLAKTHTAQQSISADRRIVGYRRELEGAYSCGLCIVASTVRYRKADLMPIHPACDCQPVPLYADEESDWQREADARLASAHQAIADKFGTSSAGARGIGAQDAKGNPLSYKDALVTHEHGEIGPVLAVKYRPFTGPAAVKNGKAPGSPTKPTPKTRAESTPEQRASMTRSELAGLERNLTRLTNDKQRAWTQQRIDLLRKQLG